MSRYLIIENESKLQALILDAIKLLDPQAVVETFEHLHLFNLKVSHFNDDEKKEFLNFDFTLLGFSDLPLKDWKKNFEDFKSLPRKPSPICLSGHENATLTVKFLQQFEIYNFIFKPYDPLILKESIYLALQKEKKAKTHEIKSQKANAMIGVLKEVELQSISELGFMTFSDMPIPLMSVAEYFSPLFKVGKKQSVWAQCLVSTAHPQKPKLYINKFQFYCVDKMFLNLMRKYVASMKTNETSSAIWNLEAKSSGMPIKMAVIAPSSAENIAISKDIQAHYRNLKVEIIDIGSSASKSSVFDHDLVLNLTDLEAEKLVGFFKKEAQFFWMRSALPADDKLKDLVKVYKEIFYQPVDKSYFYKKMKTLCSVLSTSEPLVLLNITCHEKIKAAQIAKISEINEVFINFIYPRELDFNTVREFIFLSSKDVEPVEIPGFCHYKEKAEAPKAGEPQMYLHQFVFFGMTDYYLKEIRLWLLLNHVNQNKN